MDLDLLGPVVCRGPSLLITLFIREFSSVETRQTALVGEETDHGAKEMLADGLLRRSVLVSPEDDPVPDRCGGGVGVG